MLIKIQTRYFPLLISVILLFTIQLSFAAGTTGVHFLKMNIGSRSQGMGNAYTAMTSDINSIYYNPAGIGFAVRPAVMFYHANWIEDISVENFTGTYPLSADLMLSGGISFLHLPDIAKYDIDLTTGEPVEAGAFQVSNFVTQFGLGYRLNWDFSLGFNVKYVQERLDEVVASGMAFDVGFLYKLPVDYLRVGFAVQNIGPKIKYEEHREKLPLTYRIGLAYKFPYHAITLALDGVKSVDENWKIYPGMEVELMDAIALRGGYQFGETMGSGYNIGLGFKFMDRYNINYVYSPRGILGNTHRAEVVINFGNLLSGLRTGNYSGEMNTKHTSKQLSNLPREELIRKTGELPVPGGLKAVRFQDQVIFSWDKIDVSDAEYNVYIEIPNKTGIVKINKNPIRENSYSFRPKVKDLEVRFYITSVKGEKESKRSEAMLFTDKPA